MFNGQSCKESLYETALDLNQEPSTDSLLSQGTTNKVIPPLIFGCLSIAAGLLALLLPETKGKHLSETLEEGENFEK